MLDRVLSDSIGFSSAADRFTYLLSQYRVPVTLSVLAGAILVGSGRWRLPQAPSWMTEALIPIVILAIPTYAIWRSISQKVVNRDSVTVLEYGGPADDPRVWRVPPETWANRTVEGSVDAHRPDSGSVWKAYSVEWMDDISELRVRGVWTDLASPGELFASQKKFNAIYTDMTAAMIQSSALTARVSEAGVSMYDQALVDILEMSENGRLPEGIAPSEIIDDLKQDVSDNSINIENIGEIDDEPDRIDSRNPNPDPETDPESMNQNQNQNGEI